MNLISCGYPAARVEPYQRMFRFGRVIVFPCTQIDIAGRIGDRILEKIGSGRAGKRILKLECRLDIEYVDENLELLRQLSK
jgi:hypothetical protein